jgi:Na+/melibiose symporter-like transporter
LFLFCLFFFFSLIFFVFNTKLIKSNKISADLEKKLKAQGVRVWDYRKILFIILFTIFFIVLSFIFQEFLKILV